MNRALIAGVLLMAASATALAADKMKVVYHLSEAEKAAFVLNTLQNHIEGVGGPDKIQLLLVVHGPAINALTDIEATEGVRKAIEKLRGEGAEFAMCGNTLKAFKLGLDDLVPGFVEVSQGGVTRIAELQSQGYVYIRP